MAATRERHNRIAEASTRVLQTPPGQRGGHRPGHHPDTTPAGPTIEIATWNTARFFDQVCDSGRCDAAQNDYEELPSAAQFQYKASQLATGITRQDADIMLLQEVESQDCIDALIAALPAGRWPVAVLGEMGQDASVDVAVLANGELVNVIRHRNVPLPLPGGGSTTFTREFLEVELLIQGRPVTVFSAHFRSKSNDDPSRRLAEARGAAAIVAASAAASPDSLVVMGGDLNDTPDSEPLLALTSPVFCCASPLTSLRTTGPTHSIHSVRRSTTYSSRTPRRAATLQVQRPCCAMRRADC